MHLIIRANEQELEHTVNALKKYTWVHLAGTLEYRSPLPPSIENNYTLKDLPTLNQKYSPLVALDLLPFQQQQVLQRYCKHKINFIARGRAIPSLEKTVQLEGIIGVMQPPKQFDLDTCIDAMQTLLDFGGSGFFADWK
ncbi:hypothetical protein D6774_04875 [Candidatus Woesearchaeota archaeon]|nr:MAG: hypothetical protein D6774_04875 [Candidatus Woesearchaeota archaeon]